MCVASPAAIAASSNVISQQYVTRNGDDFYTISSSFSYLCTASSINPGNIAAANGYPLDTRFLAGVVLAVPCAPKAGMVDCGCLPSLTVCGTDSVQYGSYCNSLCNYGNPSVQKSCSATAGTVSTETFMSLTYCTQSTYCYGRPGMRPLAGGPTGCTCPYAIWSVSDYDTSAILGMTGQCAHCLYANTTCTNMCMQCKKARTCDFNVCWGNCMSCARVPCGGPQVKMGNTTLPCLSNNQKCI